MTHDSPRSTWMTTPYRRRLGVLSDAAHLPLLGDGLCGVERETLRVDAAGRLALTQHPHALGARSDNEREQNRAGQERRRIDVKRE